MSMPSQSKQGQAGHERHGALTFGRPGNWSRWACKVQFSTLLSVLSIGMICSAVSCGYRVSSSVRSLPTGIGSLGIPTFQNLSPQYKLEQRLTAAVLKEFSSRTRASVNSSATGVDAVLMGEIRNVNSSPVTYGANTFASAFLVTVSISAKLVRLKDSAVIWEDSDFVYRERYVLNSKVTDFFSEENPALDRLARDFAASLASTILSH
jgi:hypothetical protein